MSHLECADGFRPSTCDLHPSTPNYAARLEPAGLATCTHSENTTLGQIHEVIQMVMGCTDDHLHQIIIRGQRYGEASEGALQFSTAATALTLSAFALREYEAFFYVYDFNAWWRHDIRAERRVLRQDPLQPYNLS